MFLEEVLEPTPKNSRSRRSTSPRAVQRRRIQNRLSQRNHRRRAKESSEATKAQPQYAGVGINSEVLPVSMSDNSTMQQVCGLDRTQNLHYLPGSYHEPLQYASSSENSVDYFERQQFPSGQPNSGPATATSPWYSGVDMQNLITPDDMVSLFSPDREWSQSDIERLSAPMESNVTGPDSQPTCSCRNSSEPVLGQVPEGFPLWRQNEQGPDACRIPSAPSHSELDSHRLRSETGHHGPGPGMTAPQECRIQRCKDMFMLAAAGWHLYPHLKESHRRRKLSWPTRLQ
ncbi:hypothetical protein FOBRF1_008804 [Fusarium oxysporum]